MENGDRSFFIDFSFDDILHHEIDGGAMRSYFEPALANIFLGYHESKLFQTIFQREMYYCYIDESFVVFGNKDDCDHFSHICLNLLHPSLRFAFEKDSNLTPPFLDVLVEKSFFKFINSIYRKPIFTDQSLR